MSNHLKSLRLPDLTLFTVSAILLLDTLAAAAAVGVSSIFWWLFLGLIFFLPFGLISAEMGTSYPEQGGVYAWVRNAYGKRWGSRVSWAYWVNTALWNPAIFILFAGVFKQLFAPDLSLAWQIGMGIALSWVAVLINIMTLDIGKWVPNLGAILKIIIFAALIIGGLVHVQNEGMANEINLSTIAPNWSSSLEYIPAIIYGMLGFELMSSSSEEMENPSRDIPKAILFSGIIILAFYSLGTFAVLAAVPVADVNLVEGLIDTLNMLFGGSSLGATFVLVLGVAALYTFFSNGVTWALGCNRSMAEAAIDGELPKIFAKEHPRYGTPVGAAIAMGVVSTAVLLLYGLMASSNEDLFWSLFSFSAVIFLLTYIGMMLAFLKLRRDDAEKARPFKVPGGPLVARLLAYMCLSVIVLAIVLFVYVPSEGMQWPVLIGTIVTMMLGEVLVRIAEKQEPAH
ncbi:APC family permease [Pseudoteredinibacter isoporae]|uniref:Amino acid transporter n=1 Tax=Pseudoteredinibacter isoporae TaxID=570281 RepID=A0A7X0JS81_9GAMM|nr:APC family permease [Pseudoteredinibacter isoporae]MBB6521330.1 amino acid transporter [Pseudoteredinibacter isoporae]NHO86885.1 APC family permease [Pseudoteredinibacter isoporae]NIB24663.1 APC family permease [Pseudoteredinibacter isoporae]